jgi:shikimate dehydrogenase
LGRAKNKSGLGKKAGTTCSKRGVVVPLSGAARILERLVEQSSTRSIVKNRSITVGLVGRGIQSSRSPIMHEREGARLGISYRYVLIDFDELQLQDSALGEIVDAAQRLGFAGLNVTHPFKQSVTVLVTRLADDAAVIGAVNTVVFVGAERVGYNTDSGGFAESFSESMAGCSLQNVLQLGAGGAGMAVAHALFRLGAERLAVFDIDEGRSQHLAATLRDRMGKYVEVAPSPAAAVAQADGLVNTTPVGMAKYPGMPLRADLLSPRHWVAEIIYFPAETELVRRARALGCRTLTGTGMAVYQAVLSFELFAGVSADRTAMSGHFETAA